MLSCIHAKGIDGLERGFYVRQHWDSKGLALGEVMQPKTMEAHAEICRLALAPARTGAGDAVAISSYLGTSDAFDRALEVFAVAHADQNERDCAALKAAADPPGSRCKPGCDRRAPRRVRRPVGTGFHRVGPD